ncbi:Immune-associated nucleotide-binding protein 9 [Citrus sinensis]|nr:Immune-associated nucleotide-binding protein 9 [Citrus sinensis]
MGGSAIDDDWELTSPSNGVRTVVLVGHTGNGKTFKWRASSSSVTSTCEMHRIVLKDGQVVNVIDTTGLFDFSAGSEFVGKEIVKCIGMAKDEIHAVLVVFSVRSRFSQEEEVAQHKDELEDNDETLEDYLGRECPKPLKEILQLCDNRWVLFDNKTKDAPKRTEQVGKLFSLVNFVIVQNYGQPYTNEIFAKLKEQMQKSYEDQLKRITEMDLESAQRENEGLHKGVEI